MPDLIASFGSEHFLTLSCPRVCVCVCVNTQYKQNVLMQCLNSRMIGGNGKKGVGNVLHGQNEKKQNKRSEFQKGGD